MYMLTWQAALYIKITLPKSCVRASMCLPWLTLQGQVHWTTRNVEEPTIFLAACSVLVLHWIHIAAVIVQGILKSGFISFSKAGWFLEKSAMPICLCLYITNLSTFEAPSMPRVLTASNLILKSSQKCILFFSALSESVFLLDPRSASLFGCAVL